MCTIDSQGYNDVRSNLSRINRQEFICTESKATGTRLPPQNERTTHLGGRLTARKSPIGEG